MYQALYRKYRPKSFEDVVGQDIIVKTLKNSIKNNIVTHAYLFSGPRGTGKTSIAKIFAKILNCQDLNGLEPCNKCISCEQANKNQNIDIIEIDAASNNGVDEIREIRNKITLVPTNSKYKVYIIDEAHMLSDSAFNALLKTIEEPPAYAVILLLTTNAESFLPTILSRCVTLNLKPAKDSVVRKYLMEQVKIPDYQADICVAFAQGNIGKARRLALSEEFNQMKEHAIHLVKYIQEMEISELIDSMRKITEFKTDISDYLDLLMVWYRDVLLYKATWNPSSIVFSDEIHTLRKMASKSSYEGIENILKALDKAKIRLNANVNFDLTMELLLLTMKEN